MSTSRDTKLKKFLPLLFVFLLLQSISAVKAEQVILRDQPYVLKGNIHQKLDLFVPPNVVSPSLVLFIHGGGWLTGDKGDVPGFLMGSGYAVATINMRPTSIAKFPAQYEDCLSAWNWLRENASKYGYTTDNTIVIGVSSGGHLAALMATKDYPGKENIKSVVDVSGPINLLSIVAHVKPSVLGQAVFAGPKGQLAAFIGGNPLTHQQAALEASPVTYVSAKTTPVLIIHGGADEIIPFDQANEFHRRLDVFGVKNDLVIFPTAAHNMASSLWEPAFHLFVDRYVPKPKRVNVAPKQAPAPRVQPPPTPPMSPWLVEQQRLEQAREAAQAAQSQQPVPVQQAKTMAPPSSQAAAAAAKGKTGTASNAPVGFRARHQAAVAAQQAAQSAQH